MLRYVGGLLRTGPDPDPGRSSPGHNRPVSLHFKFRLLIWRCFYLTCCGKPVKISFEFYDLRWQRSTCAKQAKSNRLGQGFAVFFYGVRVRIQWAFGQPKKTDEEEALFSFGNRFLLHGHQIVLAPVCEIPHTQQQGGSKLAKKTITPFFCTNNIFGLRKIPPPPPPPHALED